MWSQLFVLLLLGFLVALSRFIPADFRQPLRILDTTANGQVCEKQLGDGLKLVSINRSKYGPCWSEEQRN